jgi:hypothetical protein
VPLTYSDRKVLLVAGGIEQKLLGLLDRGEDIRLARSVSLRLSVLSKRRKGYHERKHLVISLCSRLLGHSTGAVSRDVNIPTPRLIFLGDLSALNFSVTPGYQPSRMVRTGHLTQDRVGGAGRQRGQNDWRVVKVKGSGMVNDRLEPYGRC